jgi:hypothetical protein
MRCCELSRGGCPAACGKAVFSKQAECVVSGIKYSLQKDGTHAIELRVERYAQLGESRSMLHLCSSFVMLLDIGLGAMIYILCVQVREFVLC